jgi:hypothetical protein
MDSNTWSSTPRFMINKYYNMTNFILEDDIGQFFYVHKNIHNHNIFRWFDYKFVLTREEKLKRILYEN